MFSVSCQFFPTPVYPTQTTQTHLITNYHSGIPLHLENGQENERRAKMAKIIAVMNEKGGVGKSVTATTLAYLLAKRGKRTALIDFDGQGHSSIIYRISAGHCGHQCPSGERKPDLHRFSGTSEKRGDRASVSDKIGRVSLQRIFG